MFCPAKDASAPGKLAAWPRALSEQRLPLPQVCITSASAAAHSLAWVCRSPEHEYNLHSLPLPCSSQPAALSKAHLYTCTYPATSLCPTATPAHPRGSLSERGEWGSPMKSLTSQPNVLVPLHHPAQVFTVLCLVRCLIGLPAKARYDPCGVQLHTEAGGVRVAHLKPLFPWLLQLRAGPLPLLSCLALEQCFTCFTVPSVGQPGRGLPRGPESQAGLVAEPSCLTGFSWQQSLLSEALRDEAASGVTGAAPNLLSLTVWSSAALVHCPCRSSVQQHHSGLRVHPPGRQQQPQLNSQVLCGAFTCRQRKL